MIPLSLMIRSTILLHVRESLPFSDSTIRFSSSFVLQTRVRSCPTRLRARSNSPASRLRGPSFSSIHSKTSPAVMDPMPTCFPHAGTESYSTPWASRISSRVITSDASLLSICCSVLMSCTPSCFSLARNRLRPDQDAIQVEGAAQPNGQGRRLRAIHRRVPRDLPHVPAAHPVVTVRVDHREPDKRVVDQRRPQRVVLGPGRPVPEHRDRERIPAGYAENPVVDVGPVSRDIELVAHQAGIGDVPNLADLGEATGRR